MTGHLIKVLSDIVNTNGRPPVAPYDDVRQCRVGAESGAACRSWWRAEVGGPMTSPRVRPKVASGRGRLQPPGRRGSEQPIGSIAGSSHPLLTLGLLCGLGVCFQSPVVTATLLSPQQRAHDPSVEGQTDTPLPSSWFRCRVPAPQFPGWGEVRHAGTHRRPRPGCGKGRGKGCRKGGTHQACAGRPLKPQTAPGLPPHPSRSPWLFEVF